MKQFSNQDGIQIIYNIIAVIQENKQYLSDIDGVGEQQNDRSANEDSQDFAPAAVTIVVH